MKKNICIYLLLCMLSAIVPLSCTDTRTEYLTYELGAESDAILFQSGAGSRSVTLHTGITPDDLLADVAENGREWCEVSLDAEAKAVTVKVKDNPLSADRVTVVTLTGKNRRQDIEVSQRGNLIPRDKPVMVSKVEATSFAEGHEPEMMIDGDASTFFNSAFGAITQWPFDLDFHFEKTERIDYLVYTPRPSGYNAWGSFGKVEIYAATESDPALTKVGEADFLRTNDIARKVVFEKPIERPLRVQVRILDGFNDRASCTEMQFFARNREVTFDPATLFTDGSCSALKPGVTQAAVDTVPILFYKQIAQQILSGKTEPGRTASFRPWQHPDVMAARNRTARYSLRDNATGIYIDKPDEEFVVLVGDTRGQELKMNVYDYGSGKNVTFPLQEGLNVITPAQTGLVYIYNHTDGDVPLIPSDDASRKLVDDLSVTVQFLSGHVNGFFDISRHTDKDWPAMLEKACAPEIDVLGTYAHVVWTVADYKKYSTPIVRMTGYIDSLVRQQHELMGLYYSGKTFANRIFIHIDYSAPAAYATDYRTAYNSGYANVICSEEGFLKRMWVLGHEVGHVNQVRPGMKWHGTTEVTNNLYAIYNQHRILGEAPRLFDNPAGDGYEFAFTQIIDAKQPYLLPDNFNNHIPKVVPFWQLYLYFVEIRGEEHFYHDLFQHYRTHDAAADPGLQQLDFVRQACTVGKTDLTGFFTAWGFLRPVDRVINDYGNQTVRITQAQIDALIAEIKARNYPPPTCKVEEITDRNYKNYIQNSVTPS
ncbi:MAG: M60 family metallopeptidase [Proteiniphilum sp.]|jgi:hypothetical protein|nr:M60 family metallopeptidase [Proteiniphilum sp.]